ncbi:MAG TPA: BREX system Lon protease-like protein BrxL [Porphyromonadaceae bacterium]|jgi:ATP-dependent Lon protease|nr:BREX system Lon protease-like protein BrxL [Porphyromonadaceae bacterium]
MKLSNKKINDLFAGRVVRKDLTNRIKGNASVPTYVLEYLLGQYCATDDPETIEQGVEMVKEIITRHFVHRDEAQVIKSTIKERGSHRIIDKVSVRLNDKLDRYEANFANLGLNKIPILTEYIKSYPKLLSEGVWCIVTMSYAPAEGKDSSPWNVDQLKPIQISSVDIDEYKEVRKSFNKEEWIALLMQTMGLNPEEFTNRSMLLQLARLIPFVENNYNLIELGPKGTGKSHVFSELSPHGILISGGEVSKAKLFVNNSNGEIGLVGYWDVVALDEFAGKTKRTDTGLVDIMKNYMANKSFSRGTHVMQAEASIVMVGNTDHTVPHMLKHTDLFDALPKDYYDTAFLDRVHAYIPGWETKKLRNEMFTSDFGFIVDYLAEILKVLRKEDHTKAYQQHFELSTTITTRDKTSIEKTFSGLVKIIYPHGEYTREEAKELLDFAIESRKRVKDQLRKMDETFNDDPVDFSYRTKDGKLFSIETLEVMEYGDAKLNILPSSKRTPPAEKPAEEKASKKYLEGFNLNIRDNQTNISYKGLFGDYLEGATEYVIKDPYIRLPYQMRNFVELCRLITELKPEDEEVRIHLVTFNSEEFLEAAKQGFSELGDSLEELGITFTYEFNDVQHDRCIEMNNGWKIILGRGLDIWQKTSGRFDIAEFYQEKRLCKEFEVTVVRG